MRGTFTCVAVKAPGFGDRRKAMLQDIAILTGGQVITEELGLDLKETTVDQLGRAEKVIVQKENTIIVGGSGDEKAIRDRISSIKSQIEETTSEFDKEKLQERLKLSGSVAVASWCCHRDRDEGKETPERFGSNPCSEELYPVAE